VLKRHEIHISMGGHGAWRNKEVVERLCKAVKCEEVYLHAYDSVSATKVGIVRCATFCNTSRLRGSLEHQTPDHVYLGSLPPAAVT